MMHDPFLAEHEPRLNTEEPSFDFGDLSGFDLNAAFQGAFVDVSTDQKSELDEKIAKIENIIQEASNPIYQDFIDFRALANQIQHFCNHSHEFAAAVSHNESVGSFLEKHHDHNHDAKNDKNKSKKPDDDDDKKKKKKKKLDAWFLFLASDQ